MASIQEQIVLGVSIFLLFSNVARTHETDVNPRSKSIILNEENWTQMLEGEWMVVFFAPWCPACKSLDVVWKDFADWSQDLGINVAQVDVTVNPGLSGRFMVTALPTIYHVLNGQFRLYRGSREKENFISFIEEKKWHNVEEIPGWKSPSSIQMSLISYFFKLSMVLRSIHTNLIEEYGIPYWGSYLIFALVTILVGAILGLILVCVIDFVFPPKTTAPPSPRSDLSVPSTDGDSVAELEDRKRAGEEKKPEEKTDDQKNESENDENIAEGIGDHANVRKRRLVPAGDSVN